LKSAKPKFAIIEKRDLAKRRNRFGKIVCCGIELSLQEMADLAVGVWMRERAEIKKISTRRVSLFTEPPSALSRYQ